MVSRWQALQLEVAKKHFNIGSKKYYYFVRDYILDNKHFAKRVIEDFNEAGLLEIHGEKYKRAYYPTEDIILQEWLERKRISCIHEENLNAAFYEREILNCILSAFDSVKEVYFMLKEAL